MKPSRISRTFHTPSETHFLNFQTIPEPSVLALVLLGLGVLGLRGGRWLGGSRS